MALLVFCITFAGLYFTANVQDVKKNGPDDVTSCSTSIAEEEKYDLNSEISAFNCSVRDEEPTWMSNNLQDATLSPTFTSSTPTPTPSTGSTKMPTTPSKMSFHLTSTPSTLSSHLTSTPAKMSSHLRTMSSETTRPESTVRTTSVLSLKSSFDKERHTEIFSSEKITLGGEGSDPGKFGRASGVAVSSDNEIYVADTGNERVQVFSLNGAFLRLLKTVVPDTNGQSMFPEDVAMDRKGYLWVVGFKLNIAHIVKYNREGLPETTFGLPSESIGNVRYKRLGIAADVYNDRIIVTSNYGYIHIFYSNGSLIHEIPCKWYKGCNVASGNEGDIIVLKSSNSVQVYNRDGHPLFKFRIGRGINIEGICTDSLGHIIVAKAFKKKRVKIFMFTSRGEFVRILVHIRGYVDEVSYMAVGPAGQLVVSKPLENVITIFPPQTVSP
ncbi:uncharacterized protein LOC144907973 [Branchiostoma floridae x Branchiostoma belcheri]